MFYFFSKMFWLLFQPSVILVLSFAGALGLFLFHRSGPAIALAAATAALLLAASFAPLGAWLLAPLEQRFAYTNLTAAPFGIIALGGGDSERVAAFVGLSNKFKAARVLYSGADEDSFVQDYSDLGGDLSRLVLEPRSRNTDENARYSSKLMKPQSDQRWLLVTSAAHMPRAVGCFRRAGFQVDAYPVSYVTKKAAGTLSCAERLKQLDIAVKEWVGLLAYRLFQKTDVLFPSPG